MNFLFYFYLFIVVFGRWRTQVLGNELSLSLSLSQLDTYFEGLENQNQKTLVNKNEFQEMQFMYPPDRGSANWKPPFSKNRNTFKAKYQLHIEVAPWRIWVCMKRMCNSKNSPQSNSERWKRGLHQLSWHNCTRFLITSWNTKFKQCGLIAHSSDFFQIIDTS